jgi:hypothetical protein
MHLVLVAPADCEEILDIPANCGYQPQRVLELLDALATVGISWESLDSSSVGAERLSGMYWEAAALAVRRHIQVSGVFGSRRASGLCAFGMQVPALLIYSLKGGPLAGVFPHASKRGPLVTITSFLVGEVARRTGEDSDLDIASGPDAVVGPPGTTKEVMK